LTHYAQLIVVNLTPEYFPIVFVAGWTAILLLFAYVGGWQRLSEKYRFDDIFPSSCQGWQWGKFGWIEYKGCLWTAVDARGLYLKTGPLFFFRAFHPPLLIPWSDIRRVEEKKIWWLSTLSVELNNLDVQIVLDARALSDAGKFLGDKLVLLERKSPV
jgi:hypothetical protein